MEIEEIEKEIEIRMFELSEVYGAAKVALAQGSEAERQIKNAKSNLLNLESQKHNLDRTSINLRDRLEVVVNELHGLYARRKDVLKNPSGAKMGRKIDAEEK